MRRVEVGRGTMSFPRCATRKNSWLECGPRVSLIVRVLQRRMKCRRRVRRILASEKIKRRGDIVVVVQVGAAQTADSRDTRTRRVGNERSAAQRSAAGLSRVSRYQSTAQLTGCGLWGAMVVLCARSDRCSMESGGSAAEICDQRRATELRQSSLLGRAPLIVTPDFRSSGGRSPSPFTCVEIGCKRAGADQCQPR